MVVVKRSSWACEMQTAPLPQSSGSSSPNKRRASEPGRRGRGGKGGLGPWARLILGLLLAAAGAGLVFSGAASTALEAALAAGTFSVGLASIAWQLLPGQISFKKAGIVATGGIALFLILFSLLRGSEKSSQGVLGIGQHPSPPASYSPA